MKIITKSNYILRTMKIRSHKLLVQAYFIFIILKFSTSNQFHKKFTEDNLFTMTYLIFD